MEMSSSPALPFDGLAVLDLSQGIAGPYCGTMFALQGATVTKVEPPNGDWVRLLGGGSSGMTALSIASNLGKQSISLDAKKPEGHKVILELSAKADVLIENYRPGVVAKLGLDYDSIRKINPNIIYVSITGFGESGPWAYKPGTDSVLQAFTGIAFNNRDEAGFPRRLSIPVPDTVTALYAANNVAAALYARGRTGRGRHISLSLTECCAAFQIVPLLDTALNAGKERPPTNVPTGMFATADGFMALLSLREEMWRGLCKALDRLDWLEKPEYADHIQRGLNASQINREVAAILKAKTTDEWIRLLEEQDVLCGEVFNYDQFRDHPQVRHMGYFASLTQEGRDFQAPYLPGTDREGPLPAAPRTGQDTRKVLAGLGYSAERIADLEASGSVFQGR